MTQVDTQIHGCASSLYKMAKKKKKISGPSVFSSLLWQIGRADAVHSVY